MEMCADKEIWQESEVKEVLRLCVNAKIISTGPARRLGIICPIGTNK
jgi:hypothetical protein